MVFGFGNPSSWLSRAEAKASEMFLHKLTMNVWASIAGAFLVSLGFITFFFVVARKSPLSGVWLTGHIDISGNIMAMLAAFSLAYCWYIGGHVRIGVLRDRLGVRARGALDALAALGGALWMAAVVWAMWETAIDSLRFGSVTEMIRMPLGPPQMILTIMLGHYVLVLLRSFVGGVAKASGRPVQHDGLY